VKLPSVNTVKWGLPVETIGTSKPVPGVPTPRIQSPGASFDLPMSNIATVNVSFCPQYLFVKVEVTWDFV
jgi:hypothetical protein